MPVWKRAATILLGTATTGLWLAAPAGADPGFDPCRSSVPFVCRMFPVMPDLDHDVDLTQDPDALTRGPGPGNQPGADLGGG
jgi:hypothetical protein